MLPAFADVSDLADRLAGGLLDADETRAQAALDDASVLIRAESGLAWVNSSNALDFSKGNAGLSTQLKQDILQRVCVGAALRALTNPESYTQESVGSFSATRADSSIDVYLGRGERRLVRQAAGRSNIGTVTVTRSVDGAPELIDCINDEDGGRSTMPFTYDPLLQ